MGFTAQVPRVFYTSLKRAATSRRPIPVYGVAPATTTVPRDVRAGRAGAAPLAPHARARRVRAAVPARRCPRGFVRLEVKNSWVWVWGLFWRFVMGGEWELEVWVKGFVV